MEWILYFLGGLIVLAILVQTGIIREFFTMIVTELLCCGVGALICYLITDKTSPGSDIGFVVGFVLYILYCLTRIISPTETIRITGDDDGNILSKQTLSDRGEGIAGIVMLFILIIIYFLK